MKLAFQGELGAFSHLAVIKFFPKSEIKTCQTFEECFRLATGNLEYKIIIPIENSNASTLSMKIKYNINKINSFSTILIFPVTKRNFNL